MRTLGVTNTVSEEATARGRRGVVTASLADWTVDAVRHVFENWGNREFRLNGETGNGHGEVQTDSRDRRNGFRLPLPLLPSSPNVFAS